MLDWLNRTGGWVFIVLGVIIGLYGGIRFIYDLLRIGYAIATHGLTSFLFGGILGTIAGTAVMALIAYFLIKRGKTLNDYYK